MKKVLGIIACNYQLDKLREMTQRRPIAATPFGGRYIMSDFVLSSMVNSGMTTVGFMAPYLYRPILEHLGSGKEWNLDRKVGGLFILPGTTNWIYSHNRFSLKDLAKNIDFLQKDKSEYVLLSGSNNIFNIDYKPVLDFHRNNEADVTLIYKELVPEQEEDDQAIILEVDSGSNVTSMKKALPQGGLPLKYFTDMILIGKQRLIDCIDKFNELEDKDLTNVIEEQLGICKVLGYPLEGYFGRIYSKESYYKQNMELMKGEVADELFMGDNRIITRIKDNPPTKFGHDAEVRESFISSGCLMNGDVERSIFCRGVHVAKGAKVRNSIIMHDCTIGANAVLENVILDKSVEISDGMVIKGDGSTPVFIQKTRNDNR